MKTYRVRIFEKEDKKPFICIANLKVRANDYQHLSELMVTDYLDIYINGAYINIEETFFSKMKGKLLWVLRMR